MLLKHNPQFLMLEEQWVDKLMLAEQDSTEKLRENTSLMILF